MTLTHAQRQALEQLAGPGDHPFRVSRRVWEALLAKGFAVQRRGFLCVTAQGRAALAK